MIFAESCWKTSDVEKTVNLGISPYFKTLRIEFSAPLIRRCSPWKAPPSFSCSSAARKPEESHRWGGDLNLNPSPLRCWNRPVCKQLQPEKPLLSYAKHQTLVKTEHSAEVNVQSSIFRRLDQIKNKTQIRSDATKTCSLFQPYSHLPAPTTEHSLTTPSLLPNFDNDATCNYSGPQRLCKSI